MPDLRTQHADAHRFAPAAPDEEYVYGACSPGWHTAADHEEAVDAWVADMQSRGIERVCCLVPCAEFAASPDSYGAYRSAFGRDRTRHVPLRNRRVADPAVLTGEVLPFLDESVAADEPVVVHCLAGLGRTGQVLAAWLVHDRGYTPARAIDTVEGMGRAPDEPVRRGDASPESLIEMLRAVR